MADNGVGIYNHAMEKRLKDAESYATHYKALAYVYEEIIEKQAEVIKLLKGREKIND